MILQLIYGISNVLNIKSVYCCYYISFGNQKIIHSAPVKFKSRFLFKMSHPHTDTTESQRKIILHLHNQGNSYSKIAEIMERSRFTIRRVIKRFKGADNLKNKKRNMRKPLLIERESSNIIRNVKVIPRLTSP